MISAHGLSKRYGATLAVDDLSFAVAPGVVTGFLGPNGSGKSTTMRMILGLDRPTSGTVTVHGRPYVDLPAPLRHVGALLEAKAADGVRTARNHLRWIALANALPERRVDEVLELVGLTAAADQRLGGFSLGMSQRLGIATALLGDPPVLLFDEPVNGLDPEGIVWVRSLMRGLAAQGRTVLVSSHLMNEMEATADHVIVIGRGRLIAETTMAEFTQRATPTAVHVVSPQADVLRAYLEHAGATVTVNGANGHGTPGALVVQGLTNVQVGELAARAGVVLHELSPGRASLEQAFIELTHGAVDYRSLADHQPPPPTGPPMPPPPAPGAPR